MKDERLPYVDTVSWAHESLIGQLREWTPKAKIRNVTANANVNPLDGWIRADATSGAITLSLETAVGCDGRIHWFNKTDSSSNTVTLDPNGSETIGGESTLVLTAQNDAVIIVSNGVNWDVMAVSGDVGSGGGSSPAAQYQLLRSGLGNLALQSYGGNQMYFPHIEKNVLIPHTSLELSTSGLSASTNYYIYATTDGSEVDALEASTTAPTTHDPTRIYVMTGDNTKVCVGFARTNGSTQWVDTTAQRWVRSMANGGLVHFQGADHSGTESSGSFAETSSSGRVEFLSLPGDVIDATFAGVHSNSAAGSGANSRMTYDATAFGHTATNYSNAGGDRHSFCTRGVAKETTFGTHTILAQIQRVTSGTATQHSGNICGVIMRP